jgi:hypothetical protein
MNKREERRKLKEEEEAFRNRYNYERYIPTPDDWYPSFLRDDGVFAWGRVSMRKLTAGTLVRVSFWGNDDFFIEREHRLENFESAISLYESLVRWMANLAYVSWKDLYKLGFGHL